MTDSLTDVQGILVGHDTDEDAATGCTVILCPDGAVASVDVRGAAPGSREVALLDPIKSVQAVQGIFLTGGSAYGLDAAGGVMRWLEERGKGFPVGLGVVPIVPTAVLFDLAIGRFDIRPTTASGYVACQQATDQAVEQGCIGAGTGATVGKLQGLQWATKTGIGSASYTLASGVTVGALVAVNAFGDVIDPKNGEVVAGIRLPEGGFDNTSQRLRGDLSGTMFAWGQNTTLAVVATDAQLDKVGAKQMAQMAHNGLARSINPVHTMFDGDTIFALATGKSQIPGNASILGTIAAEVLAEAVLRAVHTASSLAGVPSRAEWVAP